MKKGKWIQTYSGNQFWPLDPCEEDINIIDIAHGLSMLCRYTGHTDEFYSVAQHSIEVSKLLPSELTLWGLLHDAAEAYVGDLNTVVKREIPEYRKIEKDIMKVICRKFKLSWPEPPEIKHADLQMLYNEKDNLMKESLSKWWNRDVKYKKITILPMNPLMAKALFLDNALKLGVNI